MFQDTMHGSGQIPNFLFLFFNSRRLLGWKNREKLSFDGLITELKDGNWTVENREETIKKIEEAKHLWKSILYVI